MSNPARSLSASVEWKSLLRELSSPVVQCSFPAQTSCPVCHAGVLTIYQDFIAGGQWHQCTGCGSTGDLIELASRAWKLSITATIVKLGRRGIDSPHDREAINRYIRQHVEYRQGLTDLWRDAAAEMTNPSSELQRLIGMFNLRSAVPTERWQKGPGSLLGGMTTERIERTFAPGVMEHADEKGQRCSPSEHAIFTGPDWHDALVVPYYDLPGRICGFLFVGREGRYPDDFVYRRANLGPRGNQFRPAIAEAGLAMHPRAIEASNAWGRSLVALARPITTIALQARHFEQSQMALPLVSWYDSLRRMSQHENGQRVRTQNAWQLLGNRQVVVFWMPKFCVATIEQAIAINGLISTVGPRRPGADSLQQYLWKYTPRQLIQHIMKSACPWQEVLSQSLDTMSDTAIERHLERMQVDGIDVERTMKKCAAAAQRRVRHLFDQAIQRSATLVNGKTVVERAGKWYLQGRLGQESLISDGILRLDYVLSHQTQNKTYVRGRIIYDKRTVKFREPLEMLEKRGLRWMRDRLVHHGIGYMLYDSTYQRHVVELARVFQEPGIKTAITSIGWNEEYRQFVFPKFAIDERGDVVHPANKILDRPAPARRLRPPELCLTPAELDYGGRADDVTRLFWAVLGCVIANVTAAACHQPRAGIALLGAGAEQMGQTIAAALGCLPVELESAKDVRQALKQESLHGWPLLAVVRRRLQRRIRGELLEGRRRGRPNMILSVDWMESRLLALGDKWDVVEATKTVNIRPELKTYAAKFVVAYLQDLCRRQFLLGHWRKLSDAHAENILRDMARYVGEQGGNKAPILAARKMIRPAQEDGHATALGELVAHGLRSGKLRIAEEGQQGRDLALVRLGEAYRLHHKLLMNLTGRSAIGVPRIDQVTAVLDDANVLVEEQQDSWVLDGAWLDQQVDSASQPLRVVG